MNELDSKQKDKLVNALQNKMPNLKCPMCSAQSFALVDGYFTHPLQFQPQGMTLGGSAIPTAALICGNCGFVSEHALGVLGLLNQGAAEVKKEQPTPQGEGDKNG